MFSKKESWKKDMRKTYGPIKDCCLSIGEKHGKISAIKLKIFQNLKWDVLWPTPLIHMIWSLACINGNLDSILNYLVANAKLTTLWEGFSFGYER